MSYLESCTRFLFLFFFWPFRLASLPHFSPNRHLQLSSLAFLHFHAGSWECNNIIGRIICKMAMVTSFLGNGEDGYNYIIEADDDAPMQKMKKWLHSFFSGMRRPFYWLLFYDKKFRQVQKSYSK